MPCGDITDYLELTIAADDKVIDYSLNKRTCGGAVGEDRMLGPWLFKRTASQVIDTTLEDFFAKLRTHDDLKEYLVLKHFLAVRTALEIYAGRQSGGLSDHCTIEAIEYGPDEVRIAAHLDVRGLTDEIQACKNCCGSKQAAADGEQFAV